MPNWYCWFAAAQLQFLIAFASPSGPMPHCFTEVLPHMACTVPWCIRHTG
jgi:hypothetical protein